jgi:hypothetical protein
MRLPNRLTFNGGPFRLLPFMERMELIDPITISNSHVEMARTPWYQPSDDHGRRSTRYHSGRVVQLDMPESRCSADHTASLHELIPFLEQLPDWRLYAHNSEFFRNSSSASTILVLTDERPFQLTQVNVFTGMSASITPILDFQIRQQFTALSEKSDSSSNALSSSTTKPSACRSNSLL